jgi:hypothetical protein
MYCANSLLVGSMAHRAIERLPVCSLDRRCRLNARQNMPEALGSPELLARRVAYRGYLTVAKLLLRLRDGSVVYRDVEYHGDAAAVLTHDPVRRCGLVARLFRGPVFAATGERQLDDIIQLRGI